MINNFKSFLRDVHSVCSADRVFVFFSRSIPKLYFIILTFFETKQLISQLPRYYLTVRHVLQAFHK